MEIKTFKQNHLASVKTKMIDMGLDVQKIEREMMFALQILNDPKNSYLRRCTQKSILESIINLASIKLSLSPAKKETYLVPRKKGDEIVCCLDPSYIGLVKLLIEGGKVSRIQTNIVYEGDEIEVNLAEENPIIKHIPYDMVGNEKGVIKFLYCNAHLTDGGIQHERMTFEDICEIRDRSEAYKSYIKGNSKSCIWVDHEGEMCRKTILKRIYKYLPKGDSDHIDNAIQLSDSEFTASNEQLNYIEDLMRTSTLSEDQKLHIETFDIPTLTYDGYFSLKSYLTDNQKNPIESGSGYDQKDINKELDKKMAQNNN